MNTKVYYLYSTEFSSDISNMRYIGQTKQLLENRLKAHVEHALKYKDNIRVYNWIRDVYSRGFEVKAACGYSRCS